jgi:hypothetical protein
MDVAFSSGIREVSRFDASGATDGETGTADSCRAGETGPTRAPDAGGAETSPGLGIVLVGTAGSACLMAIFGPPCSTFLDRSIFGERSSCSGL